MPSAPSDKTVILYDGGCRFCQRSLKLLKRLDWLGRFEARDARNVDNLPPANPPLVPAKLMEEMHLVSPRGKVSAGFRAYRHMAWRLPIAWPIAPFLYLPGVLWLGNRLYLRIARNRYQLVPCHDGACRVGHAR